MKYKRVLLKLSGEALRDEESNSILSNDKLQIIAKAVKMIKKSGVQLCIVVGAGNIWRGKLADTIGIDPAQADYMGMLGTVINGMAIESALLKNGISAKVMSAIEMNKVAEPYIFKKARSDLAKGEVIIFAGGTGNPFFTTDTCAALRAKEMKCDAILMAKNGVDGVYSDDPKTNPDAKFIKEITFDEVIAKGLKVMDLTAVSLLRDSSIIIRVFDMGKEINFEKVIEGDEIGTVIKKGNK